MCGIVFVYVGGWAPFDFFIRETVLAVPVMNGGGCLSLLFYSSRRCPLNVGVVRIASCCEGHI